MVKKTLIILFLAVVAAFAFDWGVYGGPRAELTFTNMEPVRVELNADTVKDYNFPAFPFLQPGFSFPIYVRLWRFTIGGGNFNTWQWSTGDDWKVNFNHDVNMADFGYILDLTPNLRLRPTLGIGSYNIRMRLLESGGSFGEPGDYESSTWYYSSFAMGAGLSASYIWKIEKRIVVGVEAKVGYVFPLESGGTWDGPENRVAVVPDFYPHTPTVGVGLVIGYEHLDFDFENDLWDDVEDADEEDGWED